MARNRVFVISSLSLNKFAVLEDFVEQSQGNTAFRIHKKSKSSLGVAPHSTHSPTSFGWSHQSRNVSKVLFNILEHPGLSALKLVSENWMDTELILTIAAIITTIPFKSSSRGSIKLSSQYQTGTCYISGQPDKCHRFLLHLGTTSPVHTSRGTQAKGKRFPALLTAWLCTPDNSKVISFLFAFQQRIICLGVNNWALVGTKSPFLRPLPSIPKR